MVKVRQGFTLIELIFVIVIIGILSAFAVPKFQDLRANAELNTLIKIVGDIGRNAEPAVLNMKDLVGKEYGAESNASHFTLKDILKLEQGGDDWDIDAGAGALANNVYTYKTDAIVITLNDNNMTIDLDCSDKKIAPKASMVDKCKERLDGGFDATTNKKTVSYVF